MYCSKCGVGYAEGAAFCASCGQSVSMAPAPGAGVTVRPGGGVGVIAGASAAVQYAGFWERFLAYLIDGAIMGIGIVAVFAPLAMIAGLGAALSRIRPDRDMDAAGVLLLVGLLLGLVTASLLVTWLYHALMESSSWQATVGKRALGLIVTDLQGHPITFWRATGRHFAKLITNLIPLAIGYIIAAFTERRQAIHDMIASCLVLKNS